jgi:hypothetical protein
MKLNPFMNLKLRYQKLEVFHQPLRHFEPS